MKIDIGKILNSINRGKTASSDTLYVSSKKDPRLKSYQDSLSRYNSSASDNTIKDITKYNQYKKVKPNLPNQKIQPTEMWMPDIEVIQELEKKGTRYKKMQPVIDKSNSNIYYKDKDGNVIDRRDGTTVLSQADKYKKPERPVAYKQPTADTLFVSDKNDKRLKAYNDSLSLHNDARKYYDVITGDNSGSKDRNYRNYGFKAYPFHKYNTLKGALRQLKENAIDIPKENLKFFSKEEIKNIERFKRIAKKTSSSKINPIGTYPLEGFAPAYKKPTRPVAYKKPEPPKQNIEQVKQEVLQAIQNKYEGRPVYSGTVGSGGPSALIGFANNQDTTFIKPEDYERFAVPKYARQFIESKKKKK